MKKALLLSMCFLWTVPVLCASIEKGEFGLPHGFYQEGGTEATSVAVGSKNGRMIAACLAAGKLNFFNQNTMSADPWLAHKAIGINGKVIDCFKEVAMADDGTVVALSADATTVYYYHWPRIEMPVTMVQGEAKKEGRWEPFACENAAVCFKHISVGNV